MQFQLWSGTFGLSGTRPRLVISYFAVTFSLQSIYETQGRDIPLVRDNYLRTVGRIRLGAGDCNVLWVVLLLQ
jgi:hypothetical protein